MYDIESKVVSYCRTFPDEFCRSKGTFVFNSAGRRYLDFLSGCGSLNYGHNDSEIKAALLEYISAEGIAMSLDLHTRAKKKFCDSFERIILHPRSMNYLMMFPGPTGANAVEAAIKIARKATGRRNVIAFTNAFHGCSLGALALTGSIWHRGTHNPIGDGVTRIPYDNYFGAEMDTAAMLAQLVTDPSGGIDPPAAIILEVIQGEGGLNCASPAWLSKIQSLARQIESLLIIDDIQAGCGRSGRFFSFEGMERIEPDIVIMAKALSGYGLPMSLVLLAPQYDVLLPGEHNGTFRGNCHAFVTAAATLEQFWEKPGFLDALGQNCALLTNLLNDVAERFGLIRKGRGMMQGLAFATPENASQVRRLCYRDGLILECSGPYDEVLKLLPPLIASPEEIRQAIDIITSAIAEIHCVRQKEPA